MGHSTPLSLEEMLLRINADAGEFEERPPVLRLWNEEQGLDVCLPTEMVFMRTDGTTRVG